MLLKSLKKLYFRFVPFLLFFNVMRIVLVMQTRKENHHFQGGTWKSTLNATFKGKSKIDLSRSRKALNINLQRDLRMRVMCEWNKNFKKLFTKINVILWEMHGRASYKRESAVYYKKQFIKSCSSAVCRVLSVQVSY